MASKYRNWVFTWNNYTEEDLEYLHTLDTNGTLDIPEVKYVLYGKETAPQTGTPHLQGLICFTNRVRRATVSKTLKNKCYIQECRDFEAAIRYCKKEGDWTEHGYPPLTQEARGARGKEAAQKKWNDTRNLAMEGKLEEVDPQIFICHYGALKNIQKDYASRPPDCDSVTGLWIYGAAGVGKSRFVRDNYEAFYYKMANKWWDGYKREEIVLMEDIDPSHHFLGHHIKIWSDRYAFLAENKGGALYIRPRKFIITSQYHPNDIWQDTPTREAILRRFELKEMTAEDNL